MTTPNGAREALALERVAEAMHARLYAEAWREGRYADAAIEHQRVLAARAEAERIENELEGP